MENNSSDLVSLKDNVEAKRIPGYIVIKINGRFTFANYERIIAKLDKKLKNPVIEEELHVRKWDSVLSLSFRLLILIIQAVILDLSALTHIDQTSAKKLKGWLNRNKSTERVLSGLYGKACSTKISSNFLSLKFIVAGQVQKMCELVEIPDKKCFSDIDEAMKLTEKKQIKTISWGAPIMFSKSALQSDSIRKSLQSFHNCCLLWKSHLYPCFNGVLALETVMKENVIHCNRNHFALQFSPFTVSFWRKMWSPESLALPYTHSFIVIFCPFLFATYWVSNGEIKMPNVTHYSFCHSFDFAPLFA